MLTKRQVVLFAVLVIAAITIIVSLVQYSNYQKSLTPIAIHYNSVDNAEVHLYRGAKQNLVEPETTGEAIRQIESGKIYQVEDWPHVIVVSGNGIEPLKQVIYPKQRHQDIYLNISVDKKTLAKQLDQEESYIKSAIASSNSKITKLYTIDDIAVFGDGTWATARLHYTGKDRYSRDTLSVVLQQASSGWSIKAGPKISISQAEVPEAPIDALISVIPEIAAPS